VKPARFKSTGGKGEAHTGFLWVNLRERDHLEYLEVDGRINMKIGLQKWDGGHGLD